MERKMELIRYNLSLSGFIRFSSEDLDRYVEKIIGIRRNMAVFYTVVPSLGGEEPTKRVAERTTLEEILSREGEVYVADCYLADRVIYNHFVEQWAEQYLGSLKRVWTEEDVVLSLYVHEKRCCCWCGCGKVDGVYNITAVEFLWIPPLDKWVDVVAGDPDPEQQVRWTEAIKLSDLDHYKQELAARGFAVISINYL